MIVGGQSNNPSQGPSKTEDKAYALSLDRSVDVPSCLDRICDYPHYVRGASSAIFEDGLPTVCGGRYENTSPTTYYKECYKYNFTNAWDFTGSKNYAKHTRGM